MCGIWGAVTTERQNAGADAWHHRIPVCCVYQWYPVYTMKQTWSKLRAHLVHVYIIEYVCLMFASSCKRGITELDYRRYQL